MTIPVSPAAVLERAQNIQLIALDVDGTLTTGSHL